MIEPILITGAARSGTSMVAGCINICGAFGGQMSKPNQNNRKGMFENHAIRQQLVKPYLREMGMDPLGQFPLPDISTLPIPNDWRSRVEAILKAEGYQDGPWMYKGAKMALTWPLWHHAFPNAKWIIVRRKTSDIVASCFKTNFMKAFQRPQFRKAVGAADEAEGWAWWVKQHKERFVEMISEGVNVKWVWPERMVIGNYTQMMETMEWLGLPWKSDVLNFVDPKLWKSRRSKP